MVGLGADILIRPCDEKDLKTRRKQASLKKGGLRKSNPRFQVVVLERPFNLRGLPNPTSEGKKEKAGES